MASSSNPVILPSGTNSGLTVNIHPLAILNISDVWNRVQFTSSGSEPPKLVGALLGTESNREVAIVNSFELTFTPTGGDVEMSEGGAEKGAYTLDTEFLQTRESQFNDVFPSLKIVGWYSIGSEPTPDDIFLHKQFISSTSESPIFLLFNPHPAPEAQNLPLNIYESAEVAVTGGAEAVEGGDIKFVELAYGIETGEAERIAVDGVVKGGTAEEDSAVGHLTTQRNAIKMLFDRIEILQKYISGVVNKSAKPDHAILRQISSLVSTLPTMDAAEFQDELMTEYSDVQLSSYLSSLTNQLNALSEYGEKHSLLYGSKEDDYSGGGAGMGLRGGRGMNLGFGGFDLGGGGRRRNR
ncbi:hypothetical protein B9479_004043 [Cryptococcus floricola]|uniref:COP9 signalosome complex subunit 6 n=1 Tax=Cryptococcus floricola TaxID=2591691 RepID=A0A5D3AZ52_9TREE|nr:hypothetical protein B9479_004043 [Cryptococcus floricola]